MDDPISGAMSEKSNLEFNRDVANQLVENMNSIVEKMKEVESKMQEELKQQLQDAKETLEQQQLQVAESTERYLAKLESWKQSISNGLNIDSGSIDFESKYTDWDPKLRDNFSSNIADLLNGVTELQKSLGESGKKITESPITQQKLIRSVIEQETNGQSSDGQNNYVSFKNAVLLILALGWFGALIGGVVAKSDVDKHLTSNPDLSAAIPTGCVQYDTVTGSIRTIGVCAVQDVCSSQTKDTCGTGAGAKICYWDNVSCIPSQIITSSLSCSTQCTPDSNNPYGAKNECHPFSSPCTTDEQCSTGTCDNGQCSYQTCNVNSGTCSPTPTYDTNYSLKQQLLSGSLGFCLGGIPSQACPVASSICTATNSDGTGGACTACDSNDLQCTSPDQVINQNSNCLCVNPAGNGTKWVTYAMCATSTDLALLLLYMRNVKTDWAPMKTSIIVYILFGISILLFIITLIWYVEYLLEHVKNNI
jgi:hypothetical protein